MKSIRERRCIVLANCYYVWPTRSNQPYLVHLTDRKVFVFAGIYRVWQDLLKEKEIHSFAILTISPNELMSKCGQKVQPVILGDIGWQNWINPNTHLPKLSIDRVEKNINAYPVSLDLNDTRNNFKELMNPAGEKVK